MGLEDVDKLSLDSVFTIDSERYAISVMFGFGVAEHINSEDLSFCDLAGLSFVNDYNVQRRVVAIWNGLSLPERRVIAKEIRKTLFSRNGENIVYAQALDMEPKDAFVFMFPDYDDRSLLWQVMRYPGGDHLRCDFWIAHFRGVFEPYEVENMDFSFRKKWNAMPGALRRRIARYIIGR